MKSNEYAYKYITNGNYAIYEFKVDEVDGDCVIAHNYHVYTTKHGNKLSPPLFVNQEIRFCKEAIYADPNELIKDLEENIQIKLKGLERCY